MKYFALVALIGAAAAVKNCPCNSYDAPAQVPVAATCDFANGNFGQRGLSGALNAGNRLQANSANQGDHAGYARLATQSAGSSSTIGTSQMTIPDKHSVTDQAKVDEHAQNGSSQEQTCQVAQRKFTIGGEITVTEKYNDSLKSENASCRKGEGASQTRSRTQVSDSVCGSAQMPVTT